MGKGCDGPRRLLHEFFDLAARRYPDRVAVEVSPGPGRLQRAVVTYAELLAEADGLAARIAEVAGPGDVVGVMLARGGGAHWPYVAQLAVLKAGAAFTCIDPAFPDGHIQAVLDDGVCAVVTDEGGAERIRRSGLRVTCVIDVRGVASGAAPVGESARRPTAEPTPENLAYVIYTSGTTGAPKGVMIEHRSVVNLVASDIDEFRLTPDDRIAQGSSLAYDSSIEEIWLAFAAGATLVVMDDHASRMGPDLVGWLRSERITVFCPPPTLLRMTGCEEPARELPDLRLLYVGGEALTDDLVERWAPVGGGRRMVNGYGPTECTVTVVRGDVVAGHPVTIGRPVAGHMAWVVDAELNPVVDGEVGELCVGGPGLARGYRNRPEVTAAKFPEHPSLGRIYRTGDWVRRNSDGELVYLGRMDGQVKLRGYRVELEAVEAHLARCAGVREAACVVQGDGVGAVLAAHMVAMDGGEPPDFGAVRESLRGVLPAYMVPTRFGLLAELPRTVGGKVDRKRLPEIGPDPGEREGGRTVVEPGDPMQGLIVEAFAAALRIGTTISVDDDFFVDLGGDSLSAVAVVCRLRERSETASITTRDVYEARTAAGLAARVGTHVLKLGGLPRGRNTEAVSGGRAHPLLVTLAQALCILVGLVVVSAATYGITFELLPLLLGRFGIIGTLLLEPPLAMAGIIGFTLAAVAVTAALKWTLIGRYRAMRTPVWSGYYLRHWIVASAARTIPWNMLAGTTACGVVLRLLGARVGRRVHIERGVDLRHGGWDLLTLGDDVTLGRDARLGLVELDSGHLCVGPVEIGDRATLETRASLSGHAAVEAGALLTALSWVPPGSRLAAGERWGGVPAVACGVAPASPRTAARGRRWHSEQLARRRGDAERDQYGRDAAWYSVAHLSVEVGLRSLGALPLLVAIGALATVLGVSAERVAGWIERPDWSGAGIVAVLAMAVLSVPVWLAARAVGVRLLGRVHPGIRNRWSLAYIRVWQKIGLVESAGRWLSGTMFWPLWLRLAGMDVGRGCEISTIIGVVPENVRIGAGSFLADGIYLGGPRVCRGTVTIGETSLGRGTFLGNHAVIPAGARLPDDLFVGVCTVADERCVRAGVGGWFGNPPMALPRREVVSMDRRATHEPGPARFATRLCWELLRFALPVFPMVLAGAWVWGMAVAGEGHGWVWRAVVAAPAVTLAAIVGECLAVVALKWALLGRARAGRHPLWSCWCSRWDFLYVAWQFYALRPLAALEGTLLLCVYLRLMGAKIGRRVVLGPGFGQVADPDMIVIEDGATVSANYQAHSFEDRVLKLAPVAVRPGASVGESAVLFYGADVGEGAWVSPNSVVMKGERLTAGVGYWGCPVREVG